jgi:hypothetical protein
MARLLPLLLAVLLLSAACGRAKREAADAAPVDTATTSPATPIVDSAAPAPTTEAAPSTSMPVRPSTTTPPSAAVKPAPAPYIGRDSAFGPTYEVDSTGKVTPIRVKKPVNR